eukprot:5185101-Prymnesium_polylepis.2
MVTGPVTPTMQSGWPPKMAKIAPVMNVDRITCGQTARARRASHGDAHTRLAAPPPPRHAQKDAEVAHLDRSELRDVVLLRLLVEHASERDRRRDGGEAHEEGRRHHLAGVPVLPIGDVEGRATLEVLAYASEEGSHAELLLRHLACRPCRLSYRGARHPTKRDR